MARWLHWAEAPQAVKDQRPPIPRLGDHVVQANTMHDTNVLLVAYNENAEPVAWLIVPHWETA